jgi:aspartyl-tRNA(Asn)/glutamyl-tRNA(Gln) amidotransferase subunit B
MSKDEYTPTIGIECHVQLKTKTKLFAAVGNDARQALPNTLISHICMGLPGALPVLNEKALELAARAAFALNPKPQPFSKFDRKHYFYPDLPKGYQITQYEQPIILGGYLEVPVEGQQKRVGITRVHLEEDAGKNIHPAGDDYSLVDLNRAGTPLLEIVSEPEIHSAAEAKAFARELWLTMKYADVTDGDLYHGHVRFDVNISVSKDPSKMGIRSEIKNLNSFRSVEGAVAYEIDRQIELLEKGETVVQETRGWDEATQKTIGQRGKEEAQDYRYMPEPDIPPIELDGEYTSRIEAELPELPLSIRQKLNKLNISPQVVEDILDRERVIVYNILLNLLQHGPGTARNIAFWFISNPNPVASPKHKLQQLPSLAKLLETGKLSSTAANTIFLETIKTGEEPLKIAERLNLLQVSDEAEIEKIVAQVLGENQKAAEDVKKGEMKAIGFLVGQVMAKSKGKANPGLAQQIIKKQLGI